MPARRAEIPGQTSRTITRLAEEHSIGMIRKAGFWISMTVCPVTKNLPPLTNEPHVPLGWHPPSCEVSPILPEVTRSN